MKEKIKNFSKNIVLLLSVYFVWAIVLDELTSAYLDDAYLYAIPFTILSIFIWNKLDQNN